MRLGRVAAPLLVAMLVAGCSGVAAVSSPSAPAASSSSGGAYGGYGYGGYGSSGASASPSAAASASPNAAAGSISLAQTSLGGILVGPTGMTLYMFTPDTSTSSACSGSCASLWPPLTGPLPPLGTGLTASDFGSLTRSDGTTQVTFHGHPLYYYSGDTAAGETNGQALLGKWFALGADGNAIQ